MARKKARKNAELDEEGLKKIYTNKNFIRPEEKELATINEDEDESSPDVLQDIATTKENDNSICNETCSIPSNLKQGNISKNGIKFRSVRRSSRFFRGNQKMEKNCSEELVSCRTNERRHNFNGVRGSIYTDVEVVEKKFRRGSRRIIPLEPFSRNDQNVSTKLKQETFE